MLNVHSKRIFAGAAAAGLLAAVGCHVQSDKRGDGKNVNISTPFGGLHVRTNDESVLENIGLAAYPGATPVKKNKDEDSADVDMHFGSFQLRVKAANYHTDDPLEKVEAFYRNDMKRYGDVITCQGHEPVGEPTKTMAGLTCEDNPHRRITVSENDGKAALHLKAGSRNHQHIVGLEPDHGGTRFALVVLDLPSATSDDSR
jgi:hypothetical protein